MKPQRFESEELDEASLDYLRSARENEGRGMPGVYLDEADAGIKIGSLPGWGALIGVALLFLAFILMWALNLSDPFNLSMLITALAFLGGWLVIAWVRCLIARSRSNYVGYFKYVDPLYLWHGAGQGVWVTPLKGLQEARCKHDYSGAGGYSGSTVHIILEEGAIDLPVKSEQLAESIETFLNEAARDREGLPVERGYAAVERARLDDDDGDRAERVEGIPEPHKARTSIVWLFKYPAVIGAFALMFLCTYWVCRAWHDSAVFHAVKDRNPPELRVYISDRKNTAHRPEVLKRLKAYHEQAASNLERQPGEPDLKSGLARLIRSLDASPAPVITMAFERPTEPDANSMDGILGKAETTTLCTRNLQKVGTDLPKRFKDFMGGGTKPLQPGQPMDSWQIGEQIVAFGAATDRFPMISIKITLQRPERKGDPMHKVLTTVRIQEDDSRDAEGRAVKVSWKQTFAANTDAQVEEQFRAACEAFPDRFIGYTLQNPIPPQEKP